MKQRLLIVDDEPGIVDMMASYFSSQYEVLTAYCGNEALQKLARQPDLILLDINMPDIDGLTLCQKIRELITCPILFLTARVESADKIIGFQAGADDYIIKPFDLDELGARVAAHLRREQRHRNKATIRFFGELTIDYSARTVTVAGEPVALSKREFDIVELLSLNLPHELSGGQQQRVAIARALIAKPDIIFADEPTGNLDSKSGGEVMEMLQSIWKKMGKTLVIITHDSRIARMADRQFVIVDGVLSEVTAR